MSILVMVEKINIDLKGATRIIQIDVLIHMNTHN